MKHHIDYNRYHDRTESLRQGTLAQEFGSAAPLVHWYLVSLIAVSLIIYL